MSTLTPDRRRTALRALGRDALSELTDLYELDVGDRRVIDNHVDALIASVDFADVLDRLKRVELKAMCEALGLETGGRALRVFIDRILSLGADEEPASPPRKAPEQSSLFPEVDAKATAATPTVGRKAKSSGRAGQAAKSPARSGWVVSAASETNNDLEKRLWDAADELRANSKLKSSEYSVPVLGLRPKAIHLRPSL